MILNAYSIIVLFSCLVTGVLAFLLTIFSLRISLKYKDGITDTERSELQDRAYLMLLIANVVLVIEILSWPLLYLTLQSYISYIQGAMCIFGVTQAQKSLSAVVQIYKPLVFFLVGGWLLLNKLDSATETSPLFKRKFLFLFIVSLLVMLDKLIEIYYITEFNVEVDVGCCTTVFDLPGRKTSVVSESIFGKYYREYLLYIYYVSNSVLVFFMAFSYRGVKAKKGGVLLSITALLAAFNSVVTILAFFETIAPVIMDTPGHHCIYCMWQYAPDSILITLLFIVGSFSPGWALLLYITGRHKETLETLQSYIKRLSLIGMISIATSVILVSIHILL